MKKPALYYIHPERPEAVPAVLSALSAIDPFASGEVVFGAAVIVQSLLSPKQVEQQLLDSLGSTFVLAVASRISVSEWHPL